MKEKSACTEQTKLLLQSFQVGALTPGIIERVQLKERGIRNLGEVSSFILREAGSSTLKCMTTLRVF